MMQPFDGEHRSLPSGWYGDTLSVSRSPEDASFYARRDTGSTFGEGANVMPLEVRGPFVPQSTQEEIVRRQMRHTNPGRRTWLTQHTRPIVERVNNELRRRGYAGIETSIDNEIALFPDQGGGFSNVRSRFEAPPRIPRTQQAIPEAIEALPNAPPRLPGRATDGSVLPIRPREPIRQSLVGGSDDLREAARSGPDAVPNGRTVESLDRLPQRVRTQLDGAREWARRQPRGGTASGLDDEQAFHSYIDLTQADIDAGVHHQIVRALGRMTNFEWGVALNGNRAQLTSNASPFWTPTFHRQMRPEGIEEFTHYHTTNAPLSPGDLAAADQYQRMSAVARNGRIDMRWPEDVFGQPPRTAPDGGPVQAGRATERGYHATRAQLDGPLRASESGSFGPGIYHARQPASAEGVITGEGGFVDGGQVLPLDVPRGPRASWNEWRTERQAQQERLGAQSLDDPAVEAAAVAALRARGYIGVSDATADIHSTFDPRSVREVLAARNADGQSAARALHDVATPRQRRQLGANISPEIINNEFGTQRRYTVPSEGSPVIVEVQTEVGGSPAEIIWRYADPKAEGRNIASGVRSALIGIQRDLDLYGERAYSLIGSTPAHDRIYRGMVANRSVDIGGQYDARLVDGENIFGEPGQMVQFQRRTIPRVLGQSSGEAPFPLNANPSRTGPNAGPPRPPPMFPGGRNR
jgi:hypothetical protein